MDTAKQILHTYLRDARAANLRKLEGLGEYDVRRPMTPSGTNLLGVVKHLGGMEYGYLGEVFGRTLPLDVPGDEDLVNGADMWARVDESREFILDWYRTACSHAERPSRGSSSTQSVWCRTGPLGSRRPLSGR